jgi:predicted DCC family thiol-disulfide oxidoreductase YuxK
VEQAPGQLVYDADCGFCTTCARWASRVQRAYRTTAWQELGDLAAVGLTLDDVTTAAYWLGDDGRLWRGPDAVAMALVQRGGPLALAGHLIASRPVRPLAALVYRWVAANRHRMPGSTAACRVVSPAA